MANPPKFLRVECCLINGEAVVRVAIDSPDLLFGGFNESGVYSEEEYLGILAYWDVIPSEGRAASGGKRRLSVQLINYNRRVGLECMQKEDEELTKMVIMIAKLLKQFYPFRRLLYLFYPMQ